MNLPRADNDGGFNGRVVPTKKLEFQGFPNRQKTAFDGLKTGCRQVKFHPAHEMALIGWNGCKRADEWRKKRVETDCFSLPNKTLPED